MSQRSSIWVHIGLFAAAVFTTTWSQGPWFSAALMTILVFHEAGHYVAARWHGIDVSLPFFIPLPPQFSLGTMGAVIRMDAPTQDRNKLFDVGASGPVTGLVVAIPILWLGLSLSEVRIIDDPNTIIEGNSIAYATIKWLVKGEWLPAAGGLDVDLHPIAFGGWVGLLITMINLIPIAQLDGGHIATAWLGKAQRIWSRRFHGCLVAVGTAVCGWLTIEAMAAGRTMAGALGYGATSAAPWLTWAVILWGLGRLGGAGEGEETEQVPLTRGRQWIAFAMLLVFVLLFTPVPFRRPL